MQLPESLREQSLFRDRRGKLAVWQWPNLPLIGWLACKILAFILPAGLWLRADTRLGIAFLFTWAYLEITSGTSYFRRLLGIVVMCGIIVGFFR